MEKMKKIVYDILKLNAATNSSFFHLLDTVIVPDLSQSAVTELSITVRPR